MFRVFRGSGVPVGELPRLLPTGKTHCLSLRSRLYLELKDRFGGQVELREWFLVPLAVIDEAIQKLKDGALDRFRYDPKTAGLTPVVPPGPDRQFALQG